MAEEEFSSFASASSSAGGSFTLEDALLREAQKLDHCAKELRRAVVDCRRAARDCQRPAAAGGGRTSARRSAPMVDDEAAAVALQKALHQMGQLADGVSHLIDALSRKYSASVLAPAAATTSRGGARPIPSPSSSSSSYGVQQFNVMLDKAVDAIRQAQQTASDIVSSVAATTTGPEPASARGGGVEANDLRQEQQLLQQDGFVEVTDDTMHAMQSGAARQVGQEMREVRQTAQQINDLVAEQELQLQQAESNVDGSLARTEEGRRQLTQAAKYKLTAMTLSGALVGGLLGGPIGAVAGAKSVAGVIACAAAGTATGYVGTSVAADTVRSHLREHTASIADRPSPTATPRIAPPQPPRSYN